MDENPQRQRALILGCDYQSFHAYLRFYSTIPDVEICGFVHCLPGDPPCRQMINANDEILPIYALKELQQAIYKERIQKCYVQLQNLPMPKVQAVVNRVLATNQASVEFQSPKTLGIRSFKPVILITSIAPHLGKSQLTRYFCEVLSKKVKRVAVIIPIVPIQQSSGILNPDSGLHFEFSAKDPIPAEYFSGDDQRLIHQYQTSGAYRVFATTNTRRAIISAEQHADVIFYDSNSCDVPLIKAQTKFCVCTSETLSHVMEHSLWPGIVNIIGCDSAVIFAPKQHPLPDIRKRWLLKVLSQRTEKRDRSFFFVLSKTLSYNQAFSTSPSLSRISTLDMPTPGKSPLNEDAPFSDDSIEPPDPSVMVSTDEAIKRIDDQSSWKGIEAIFVSLPKNIPGFDAENHLLLTTQEIVDVDHGLLDWMKQAFFANQPPPLQKHFEAQVDLLEKYEQASTHELHVSNNDSYNRSAFCRLFLASHLPPGFRVTTGEIVDRFSTTTGKLDIVIVTEDCPRMTVDASVEIIAPILADSVLGVVEVKSWLTTDSLKKSLKQLRPVKSLMPSHATLETSDGNIVDDPLQGKIITGIFAFYSGQDIEDKVPSILRLYPNVADFVVIPNDYGFFNAETLRVCGISVSQEEVGGGYVKCTTRGMGLALIFGMLNSLAATRQFSGSNYIQYLGGNWGGQSEAIARVKESAVQSMVRIRKLLPAEITEEQKEMFLQADILLQKTILAEEQKGSQRAESAPPKGGS